MRRLALFATPTLILALLIFWLRPLGLIHGPIMLVYRNPLLLLAPLAIFAIGLMIAWLFARRGKAATAPSGRSSYRHRSASDTLWSGATVSAGIAFVFLIGLAFAIGHLNNRALYQATDYENIENLPEGGLVRLLPKQVADTMALNAYNSPTETLKESHIVRGPEGLQWTYEQAPDGLFRKWAKNSEGVVSLEADSTERNLKNHNEKFRVAPSMQLTDSLRWSAYKQNYLAEIAETVAVIGEDGKAVFIAPYLEYRGFPIRHPKLAGVFLIHADGKIEDLTVKEARGRDEVIASGRMYPEKLARREADAYAYKGGIINKIFLHKDQTEIQDPEKDNNQPYLMDFGSDGSKWVSVAEPYGKAFSTNAIFLTDTTTGRVQIWRVSRDENITGPGRSRDIVRGKSFDGIVFGGDSGKFSVIEPRPAFIEGELHYLFSIVPNSMNAVTKSVIVNPKANKVVAVFDHDDDPEADKKLIEFLKTGDLADQAQVDEGAENEGDEEPSGSSSAVEQVEELLRQNETERKKLEALRDQLTK